jgi:hypothetical protein
MVTYMMCVGKSPIQPIANGVEKLELGNLSVTEVTL